VGQARSVLVTGGAGFIGSHLVDALLKDGHRVTVVDNLATGNKKNIAGDADFRECDITDAGRLNTVFRESSAEIVCHHAAQVNVRQSVADPVQDAGVNIIGFLNVLTCCRAHGIRRVLLASTGGAVYGEQKLFPADETHETLPLSPYGVAKLSCEKYLFYYQAVHGIDGICLRYANVYGPRQSTLGEAGVVAIFADRMLSGAGPVINGNGAQTRDFVYVDDVVRANLLALDLRGFHVFNVGTGVETDINGLFDLIRAETKWDGSAGYGPGQKGEQIRSVLNADKIKRELGWAPTVALRDGIGRTVNAFREERR